MIVLVIEKFNRFVSKNDFHISIEISNSRNMTPINRVLTPHSYPTIVCDTKGKEVVDVKPMASIQTNRGKVSNVPYK